MNSDLRDVHAHDLDSFEHSVVADDILARLEVPPGSCRAHTNSPPPVIEVTVPSGLPELLLVMESGAHPAPVVRIDELPGALPLEVGVVQLFIPIQDVQVLRQFLRRGELIHVDVGTTRSTHLVVFRTGTHHNRQDLSVQSVDEKLLGDVVLAVGVLERQIELVVVVEDLEALVRRTPGALEVATRPIDINLIM